MHGRRVVTGTEVAEASPPPAPEELLAAVVNGWRLSDVVPSTLDLVERDPLASGGRFPGDLVRGLMELPGSFWGRAPRLYARYRAVLRASADARRRLPPESRLAFWGPLDDVAGVR
ncbi:hypothetical protein [Roseisolibacter agri]|uniref:Uncharacterized protein n=1 Tax=Roseisolibacter agri TaxID=2014610 RepID=A0AA37Q8S9_9BACT|nr:hypothetical protein [Roseisolibacter agri]GLC25156.1 hypothetical protein rosag_16690 [Roseisolibacter agri]